MVYKYITRSKGVVIFAISLIAFGSFSTFLLILSVALIPLNQQIPAMAQAMPKGLLSQPVFWISTFFYLIIFISWVVCGMGVLHLKEWARKCLRAVMAIHVINMIVNICLNVFMAEEIMSKIPVGFLLAGIAVTFSYYFGVIYFFSHPQIVRQFKYKSREY